MRMRRIATPVATVVLLGLVAAPSSAQTVSLNAACAATLSTLATVGGTTDSAIFAGPRFSVTNRIIDSVEGTYGVLTQEPVTPTERKAALKYLGAPRAQAWINAGRFYGTEWGGSYPQALAAASGLPQDCEGAAGPLVSVAGTTYTYANVTVEIVAGAVSRWGDLAFTIGPQQLQIPPGPLVSFADWAKASQAASLNTTLRSMTRTVAQTATDPTPTRLYRQLREAVEPDRAVPLRVHKLRQGGLVSGRNPYTKTYHAWRVYLKNGTPIARKVAP